MINTEILKKAIEKAINNGYEFPNVTLRTWDIGLPTPPHKLVIGVYGIIHKGSASNEQGHEDMQYQEIIFSHDFAKAFWSEEMIDIDALDLIIPANITTPENIKLTGWRATAWRFHLQLMVLEKDPIKYLEKFI